MTDPKHGTPERWATCDCKECDNAQARAMTDRDRIDTFLETIPGDAQSWQELSSDGNGLVRDLWGDKATMSKGDGTVDAATWGHLRNIVDAVRQLAFVLGAAERGDDPDIPF